MYFSLVPRFVRQTFETFPIENCILILSYSYETVRPENRGRVSCSTEAVRRGPEAEAGEVSTYGLAGMKRCSSGEISIWDFFGVLAQEDRGSTVETSCFPTFAYKISLHMITKQGSQSGVDFQNIVVALL